MERCSYRDLILQILPVPKPNAGINRTTAPALESFLAFESLQQTPDIME